MSHLVLRVPLESATVEPSILPSACSGSTSTLYRRPPPFVHLAQPCGYTGFLQLLNENRGTKDGVHVSFHTIMAREGGFSYNGGLEGRLCISMDSWYGPVN